jgi:hypothetical protein
MTEIPGLTLPISEGLDRRLVEEDDADLQGGLSLCSTEERADGLGGEGLPR